MIEIVAVLTVIAILALAFTPILIKRLDRMAGEKETSQLKAFADAFRQGVIRTRTIPDQTAWDSMISSNLGVSIAQVRLNDRRVTRAFLVDPNFRIGSVSSPALPPYNQRTNGINGSEIQPVNPRLMILSSLSQALPVASGTSSAFDVIWNTTEGAVPADSAWNGYQKGDDLKIQRIHLADLFVQMAWNNEDSTPGRISIDEAGPLPCPAKIFSGYFIDSTLLGLFDCSANSSPAYSEILHRGKSFNFANCTWQPSGDFISKAINRPTPSDLQLAADTFLAAALNPWRNAWPVGSTNRVSTANVYNAMLSFMSNYVDWATGPGGFGSGQPPNSVSDAQVDVNNTTLALRQP